MSREEARLTKERRTQFAAALRTKSKLFRWRHAGGLIFRQHGDWFVEVLPSILWQRGALARMNIKPMAVDPLFWRVVGLQENESQPLSFRANGAWVLRPPSIEAHLGQDEESPERLSELVLDWSTDQLSFVATRSIDGMLSDIAQLGPRRSQFAALEICLHLLKEDFDRALELCRERGPNETGGFTTGNKTFFDQAGEWIVASRRGSIRLA